MASKRGHVDLDPDYEDVSEQQSKRQRVFEEDAKEATRRKIENIICKQFDYDIENKEDEINAIDQRLNQTRLVMDRLRACIVANFYSKAGQQKFSQIRQNPNDAPSIHPTVKEHIGKAPKNPPSLLESSAEGDNSIKVDLSIVKKEPTQQIEDKQKSISTTGKADSLSFLEPVKIKKEPDENRGSRFKTKKRIVVGNVSKYIPVDRREENDQSTHKWMVYVRGSKEEPQIDHYVKKVWFFLHPSYRPNDLVEVSQPPFHLTRRGWGEFPVRIQLHFKDQRNKRVDIIHQLKLDRTYTGLQTLGSETLVDIELEKETTQEKSTKLQFDLKVQLKNTKTPLTENVTIKEKSPLKQKMTAKINGLKGESVQNITSVDAKGILKTGDGNKLPTMKPVVSESVTPVQILIGGISPVTSPNKINAKGDTKVTKGNNSAENISPIKNSSILLQSMLSPNSKVISGSQLLKNDLSNNLVLGIVPSTISSSSGNKVSSGANKPSNVLHVNPTSKSGLVFGQSMLGNSGLILQPTVPGNRMNTMIIRPTLQKSQSNMLLIQTLPQATRPVMQPRITNSNTVIINPLLQPQVIKSTQIQNTQPTTILVPAKSTNTTVTGTLRTQNKPQTVNALLQLSAAARLQQQASKSINKPASTAGSVQLPVASVVSQPAPITPQTLYYRCKDAQGNIFLVPQPALKQVVNSPGKINTTTNNVVTKIISSTMQNVTKPMTVSVSPASRTPVASPVVLNSNGSPLTLVQTPGSNFRSAITKVTSSSVSTCRSSVQSVSNANSPIILTVSQNGQTTLSNCTAGTSQNTSLLKSAILQGKDQNVAGSSLVKHFIISTAAASVQGQNSLKVINSSSTPQVQLVSSLDKSKPVAATTAKPQTVVQPASSLLKSGTSLLLTVNSSNGKTVVMPSQNINSKQTSVLTSVFTANATGTKTTQNEAGISKNSNLITSDKVKTQISINGNPGMKQTSVSLTTDSTLSSASNNCKFSSAISNSSSSSQPNSKGQLQVTSQGLKVIANTCTSGSVKNVNSNNVKNGSANTCMKENRSLTNGNLPCSKNEKTPIKINAAENFSSKSNGVSLLSNEFRKPVISSQNLTSLLPQKPSLTLDSSGNDSISGTLGEKKIVIDLLSETERRFQACEPEKRVICLKRRSDKTRHSVPTVVQEIKPLGNHDFPDLVSLIRAAVKRHPLVSFEADKYQHPYCASTTDEWLSWKLGKRRASEWQRACFCRRFIQDHIKADSYKGTKLWTTKQIMLWCRLHASSPHYLESTLHPFGVELTADRIGKKFSSVTCPREITGLEPSVISLIENIDEEDIDIINLEKPKSKIKEAVKEDKVVGNVEIIPPSDTAVYIQDCCQKIGIKFEPTEIEPGIHGNVAEDMIFSMMKSFVGDILTEMFASKVINGRYPDSLGMPDVFNALKNLPQSDFLTNSHLGIKVTESSKVSR